MPYPSITSYPSSITIPGLLDPAGSDSPVKPPLGLIVEVTTADGTHFQWGEGSNLPGDVPQNLGFATRLGDGFADSNVTLSRRIDRDWADINLLDDVVFSGADGSIAYEGRVSANPRSISAAHSMGVTCVGWMAHTRDRKMDPQVYVDRDPSHWQEATFNRRVALAAVPAPAGDYTATADGGGITFQGTSGQAISISSDTELMYVLPYGRTLVKLMYKGTQANTTNVEAAILFTDDSDSLPSSGSTALTLDNTLRTATPSTPERYGMLRALAGATHTPAAGSPFSRSFSQIAVYASSLTTRSNGTEPDGVYASDVIADIITSFCPRLNTSGITATTYPISHLVFLDPTDPFDAISEVNKYHRWQFGVWENKTFKYAPVDLTDYDWAVDYFDAGVSVDLQGDSTDDGVFNGICVNYTDLSTGIATRLTPDTNSELADSDPENPANRQGLERWDEITLSSPTTSGNAVQIASAALAEKNSPKGQGSITIKGHLKDRAGHWQQGWKVRAGDRVAITSSTSLSDRPRLISETSWDQDSLTLTMHVESIPQRVDAFLDRLNTALMAAGLS